MTLSTFQAQQMRLLLHAVLCLQRDSADADAPGRNAAEQQRAAISESDAKPAGGAADTAAPAHHSKQRKTLRTYGQKKAKADPAAEQTSASLTADFLALIGGKR